MLQLNVNGHQYELDIDPDTPLLWALRDHLHLRGTKYGCGIGLCGSCTVHLDDRAVRACLVTVSEVSGKVVTTIEGLVPDRNPVQHAWRELEVAQCGYCMPGMRSSADGHDPAALQGFADQFYAVPSFLADYAQRTLPVPVGFWRSVNHSQNAYFREHFIDQVARETSQDPYAFRRGLLREAPKQLAVLEAAAGHAGWDKPLPENTFRGIAVETSCGSHCAQVVELRMVGESRFQLLRVVCAIDPGHVVNPDTIAAQVESAITYGLTAALFGEISIRDGRVQQGNFDDYPMLILRQMPRVETHIVASGDFWGGVGEPPLPPIAPALCNALYAAMGKPIHSLPLSAHGLQLA